MAPTMKHIAKKCFPKAIQVTDRFHVQKLAIEALQDIRIKHRWDAIDQENQEIQQAKNKNMSYKSVYLDNGDTRKQLLARNRFLLFKSPGDWSSKQTERAKILFQLYPDIKKASQIVQQLRNIYNQTTDVKVAYTKLAHWHKPVEESGFKAFNLVAKSITTTNRF